MPVKCVYNAREGMCNGRDQCSCSKCSAKAGAVLGADVPPWAQNCCCHSQAHPMGRWEGPSLLGAHLWVSWIIVCFLPDEYKSKVACEDDKLRLSCKKSMVIAIYSAIFGRTQGGSLECPYQNLGMPMIGKQGNGLMTGWCGQGDFIYCHHSRAGTDPG